MRRPDHIAFGVNDPLPPRLALQQLAFLSAGYYYPLQTTGAVLPSMYLVASLPGSGLDAVFGMVWVVGLTQIGFSFVILRMRNVFTTEVSGVAVMLIGLGLGALGLQQMFGTSTYSQPLSGTSLLAGALALATMVGCNVWAKGLLKLLAPLTGLLVGMALSLLLGLLPEQVQAWQALPWLRLPQLPAFGWRFEAGAIVPYAVTGFAWRSPPWAHRPSCSAAPMPTGCARTCARWRVACVLRAWRTCSPRWSTACRWPPAVAL